MARDPDAQMVVFKDTRGRRSASQKIRDWVHTFKGASWAGDAVRSLTDAVGTGALFGTLAYTGRPKIISTLNPVNPQNPVGYMELIILENAARTQMQYVVPTLLGRPIKGIVLVHPDVGIAEGLGVLGLLSSLPGGDLTGFIEKAVGIGLYHALLNGFNFTIPIGAGSMSLLDAAGWDNMFKTVAGWAMSIGNAFTLTPVPAGSGSVPSTTQIAFSGLMGGLAWDLWRIHGKLQAEIDSGKLTWPLDLQSLPNGLKYGFPFDGTVLPLYIQRWLHNLGHAGLITMLFRRGLGQKLLE